MRALALLLLLSNALFFAWTQGWLDDVAGVPAQGDREPERLTRQVRPEAIRVLSAAEAASARAAASASAATPGGEPGNAAAAGASAASAAPAGRPANAASAPTGGGAAGAAAGSVRAPAFVAGPAVIGGPGASAIAAAPTVVPNNPTGVDGAVSTGSTVRGG